MAIVMLAWVGARGATTDIYDFAGGTSPGAPFGALVATPDGALYDTSFSGGVYGVGTVFALAPPAAAHSPWTLSILYSFAGGSDGAKPAILIQGPDGSLYGVTRSGGGCANCGVIFRLTQSSPGVWAESTLHQFQGGTDGAFPTSLTIVGSTLVGTTISGGNLDHCNGHGCGVVFTLAEDGTETVLHSFDGADGGAPDGAVVAGKDGVLYGTTSDGAVESRRCQTLDTGCGTVFELTPPRSATGRWTLTTLYKFQGKGDGSNPVGDLVLNADGALVGATAGFNSYPETVFKLSPPAAGASAWTETTLIDYYAYSNAASGTGLTASNGKILIGFAPIMADAGGGFLDQVVRPTRRGGAWEDRGLLSFAPATESYLGTPAVGPTGAVFVPVWSVYDCCAGSVLRISQ
jgi:uncharacterized repeat protein (TIGR03803 family)